MSYIEKNKENYNQKPYKSNAFIQTQPIRQKTTLGLLGMETADLNKARVLEIGCSFGGNIIAFALNNPESEVIGIDLSEYQINEGRKIVEKMGINNLKLYPMNILDYNNEFGKFDYIICHGVFSWVPYEIQEKILDVIKNGLSENGSAVISYNTYPGWKKVDILKDIMRFKKHIIENNNPNEEIETILEESKKTLKFLGENVDYIDDYLKKSMDEIFTSENYYIFHEYLEEYNNPFYLYEFNKRLLEKGLVHICDSELNKSFIKGKAQNEIVKETGNNHVLEEQYYDFINNRKFRTSVVTHVNNLEKIRIDGMVNLKDLLKFHIRNKFEFDLEKNCYKIQNGFFSPEDNEVLKYISEIYPNTVSIQEINEKFNDKMGKVVTYIFSDHFEVYDKKIEVINSDKIKLKDIYKRYVQSQLEMEEEIISFSIFNGKTLLLTKDVLEIMLEFDGEKTKNEVVNSYINKLKLNNRIINKVPEIANKTDEEVIYELVEKLEEVIVSSLMNDK